LVFLAPPPHGLDFGAPAGRNRAEAASAPRADIDQGSAAERARLYLISDAPLAVEGDAGDTVTYKAAARCKDFGISEAGAFDAMAEHWNPRCSPPWDAEDLRTKIRNAYAYGIEAPGASAPEAQFKPVAEDPAGAAIGDAIEPEPWVSEMNARYSVTTHHGRTVVHEVIFDDELGHERHEWLPFDDLKRRHLSEQVRVIQRDSKVRFQDKGSAWLEHRDRRTYRAEAFLPGREAPADVLNLWRGFAIEPKAGSWKLLRSHLEEIVCDGDAVAYAYLSGWMARMVQQPGEAGQVAIALKGGEGTGKGTFGTALMALFGQHAAHLTQPKHLTGAFNAHLRDKVFVFCDEAFFSGNPEHRGPLYALITEDKIQIEAKGVDAKTARNVLHIVMATNEDWAVPAGINARRFLVLKVSEARRQDAAYFKAIRDEMRNGGLAAMLHDLQRQNISGFNVFAVPQTAELIAQKVQSLKGPEAWLFDSLHRGQIAEVEWSEDGCAIDKSRAHSIYAGQAKALRDYAPRAMSEFVKAVKSILGPENWTEKKASDGSGGRRREINLGPLSDCRTAFEAHMRNPINWEIDAGHSATEGNSANG
jgi:hypothetical protein